MVCIIYNQYMGCSGARAKDSYTPGELVGTGRQVDKETQTKV